MSISKKSFSRLFAISLLESGEDLEFVKSKCEYSIHWTVGDLIEVLQSLPKDDMVYISQRDDTDDMTPLIVPVRCDFSDEDASNNEGFVMLCAYPDSTIQEQ